MGHTYLLLKIKPLSSFATDIVSDTLFGQICYTLYLMGADINKMLSGYENDPFLVVSNMFPLGCANKPQIPIKQNREISIKQLYQRKKLKKQNKILISEVINSGKIKDNIDSNEYRQKYKTISKDIVHAYINRLYYTTTEGDFSPYTIIDNIYNSENEEMIFDLYLYVKDEYKDIVIEAIKLIGQYGYGQKSTIGKGRFNIINEESININVDNKNSLFTLGNSILFGLNEKAEDVYYTPCTRFGKHGIMTSKSNPFKNPFVLSEQGALLLNIKDNSIFDRPYIGMAITNISQKKETVAQGYSLYIPINV